MTTLAKTNPMVVINNKGIALFFIMKWTFISAVLARAIFWFAQVAFNQVTAIIIYLLLLIVAVEMPFAEMTECHIVANPLPK